jgi:hypothetical protein
MTENNLHIVVLKKRLEIKPNRFHWRPLLPILRYTFGLELDGNTIQDSCSGYSSEDALRDLADLKVIQTAQVRYRESSLGGITLDAREEELNEDEQRSIRNVIIGEG